MFGEIKTSMATMAATVPRTWFPPGGMPWGRCLHAVDLIQNRLGIDAGEVVIIPSPGVFCNQAGTPDFCLSPHRFGRQKPELMRFF